MFTGFCNSQTVLYEECAQFVAGMDNLLLCGEEGLYIHIMSKIIANNIRIQSKQWFKMAVWAEFSTVKDLSPGNNLVNIVSMLTLCMLSHWNQCGMSFISGFSRLLVRQDSPWRRTKIRQQPCQRKDTPLQLLKVKRHLQWAR